MKLPIFAAVLLPLLLSAAQGQTVWRCGTDGRQYADSPCPGGREVVVADARSEAEVEAAKEIVAREQALASTMTQQRRQRERLALASGPAGIRQAAAEPVKPKPAPKPKSSKRHRPAAPDTWRAVAPASRRGAG